METFRITRPAHEGVPELFVGFEDGEYVASPDQMWLGLNEGTFTSFELGEAVVLPAMESPWHWYQFGVEMLRTGSGPELVVTGEEPAMPSRVVAFFEELRGEVDERLDDGYVIDAGEVASERTLFDGSSF